jgi:hypothetical protein
VNRGGAESYRHTPDADGAEILPAWLTVPPRVLEHEGEADEPLRASLDSLTAHMRDRIQELTDRAISERSGWIEDNRTTPRTPQQEAEWRSHVATVAAYREQHRITSEDPVRPLGPVVAADESDHLVHRQAEISVGRMLAISADDTVDLANNTPARSGRVSAPKRQLAAARPGGVEYDEPQTITRRHVEHEAHRSAEREIGY